MPELDEMDAINARSRARQDENRSLTLLNSALDRVTALAKRQALPSEIGINNFDEVKSHLRNELAIAVAKLEKALKAIKVDLPNMKISETIQISNIGELGKVLGDMKTALSSLTDVVGKLDKFNPNIHVTTPDVIIPEIKIPKIELPTINVPEPKVTVNPDVMVDLSELLDALEPLKYLSNKATNPISVRLSDGQKFIKALQQVAEKAGQVVTAFSTSTGMSAGDYIHGIRDIDDVLAGYKIADVDDDASPNYYGFVDREGNWFILKETIAAGANTYRYCKGTKNYDTALTGGWAMRANIATTYDYYFNVF